MKLFLYIFSFYIFALATLPCSDYDGCMKQSNATTTKKRTSNDLPIQQWVYGRLFSTTTQHKRKWGRREEDWEYRSVLDHPNLKGDGRRRHEYVRDSTITRLVRMAAMGGYVVCIRLHRCLLNRVHRNHDTSPRNSNKIRL